MNVRFVAEVSSNHNKDIQRSKDFIKVVSDIGCDGVKFQLFKVDQLFAPEILLKSSEHRDRKNWELPLEFIPELSEYAHELGLEFSGVRTLSLNVIRDIWSLDAGHLTAVFGNGLAFNFFEDRCHPSQGSSKVI